MNLVEVLNNKQNEIIAGKDLVVLSKEEVDTLLDKKQILAFKLYEDIPADYKCSVDMASCLQSIRAGSCLRKVLEYLYITNHSLKQLGSIMEFESEGDSDVD